MHTYYLIYKIYARTYHMIIPTFYIIYVTIPKYFYTPLINTKFVHIFTVPVDFFFTINTYTINTQKISPPSPYS